MIKKARDIKTDSLIDDVKPFPLILDFKYFDQIANCGKCCNRLWR